LGEIDFLRIHAHLSPASLQSGFAPGVFDQDSPHRFGCGGKKMTAILPRPVPVLHEPQPRLMHKGSRLKGLAGSFLEHARSRQSTEFLVDQRQQVRGPALTAAYGLQHACDVILHAKIEAETVLAHLSQRIKKGF
jgi:hypothetical protein